MIYKYYLLIIEAVNISTPHVFHNTSITFTILNNTVLSHTLKIALSLSINFVSKKETTSTSEFANIRLHLTRHS